MLLGSHVSMSGKKMLEGSAIEAHEYGETTFMIYTGAPQNTRRKSIEDLNITKGHEVMEKYGYLILLFMHHTSLILQIQPNQKRLILV